MKVIGKNIIITETEEKLKSTKSGLLLGEKKREDIRYKEGMVNLVSEDVLVVKNGDKIYFDKHAGFNLEIEKVIYTIIQEKDIVVVL